MTICCPISLKTRSLIRGIGADRFGGSRGTPAILIRLPFIALQDIAIAKTAACQQIAVSYLPHDRLVALPKEVCHAVAIDLRGDDVVALIRIAKSVDT
jgi:hypothetical protein